MSSSSISRIELTRKFNELRARLHSRQTDPYAGLRQVLDTFPEVHEGSPGTAHSALQDLLDLYLRDSLPQDLLSRVHVLTHEPKFSDLETAYRQGRWLVVYVADDGTVHAYCAYCGADVRKACAEESHAVEVASLNALYGKAMKESERQRKLRIELERARKLEARARVRPPEVNFDTLEQYRQELVEYARQLLRKLLVKTLTLNSLRYVEDIATENLLYDAARRLVQLLLMRFRKFVKKGKGRQVMQLAKTELDVLQIYERCIDEVNTQLSTSVQLCRTLQDYTDFLANRVFDEDVKQTLLQAVARQLLLQDASAYAGRTVIEAWASVRKTLALILKYLGADGQARVTTLFKLVDAKDVEERSNIFLRPDTFKLLFVNRPDIVKQLFLKYPHLIGALIRGYLSS